jgi:hypothetical protein
MLNNVVTTEDILVLSVATNINNLKKEIQDLKENMTFLENKIESDKKKVEEIKSSLINVLAVISEYKYAWDKNKDVLDNSELIEKLSEYNDILFVLQVTFGDVEISFLPELIDSQVIIKNLSIENNKGNKLDFNVALDTLYTTQDVCRGCNMGTIYTYANSFDKIKESKTVYDFFYNIDKCDIYFDTFTENFDGDTCLRGIYFRNRNPKSELENFIRISTNYSEYYDKQVNHKEVIISFCDKPTNF